MAHPTLDQYMVLQRALDSDVLRALQSSAVTVEAELRRLQSSQRVGALVRSQQLMLSQQAIQRELGRYWASVGDMTRAGMAEAAAAGAETMIDRDLLTRVFGEADVDYLTRSARASAEQALSTARERISGTSYIPLAESVYDNAALSSGKIDDLVNAALIRGASAAELAAEVRDFVNPNTPGGVRYASMRLARTELNNAFHASQIRQAQKDPWTLTVKWWLSGSHPRPDECNEYADSVHFTGGEAGHFRPSEVPAKPHPNCLCFTTPEQDDVDEFIRKFEAGDYDDYLDAEFPDISPREVRLNTPIKSPVSTTPVNKVGSDALKSEMAAAEAQRKALESSRFISKGKNRGNLNPERGYTPERAGARSNYSESLNREMNLLKRDPEKFLAQNANDPGWVDYVSGQNELLEALMKENALDADVTVARYMTGDFGDLKPGQFTADPGFLSTTTDFDSFLQAPSGAFQEGLDAGSQQWRFIIRVPKGTNALPGADYQKEIFFGPGTKQRILDIDPDTHTVYTEVVK